MDGLLALQLWWSVWYHLFWQCFTLFVGVLYSNYGEKCVIETIKFSYVSNKYASIHDFLGISFHFFIFLHGIDEGCSVSNHALFSLRMCSAPVLFRNFLDLNKGCATLCNIIPVNSLPVKIWTLKINISFDLTLTLFKMTCLIENVGFVFTNFDHFNLWQKFNVGNLEFTF